MSSLPFPLPRAFFLSFPNLSFLHTACIYSLLRPTNLETDHPTVPGSFAALPVTRFTIGLEQQTCHSNLAHVPCLILLPTTSCLKQQLDITIPNSNPTRHILSKSTTPSTASKAVSTHHRLYHKPTNTQQIKHTLSHKQTWASWTPSAQKSNCTVSNNATPAETNAQPSQPAPATSTANTSLLNHRLAVLRAALGHGNTVLLHLNVGLRSRSRS